MANNAMEQGGEQASTYGELEEHAVVGGVGAKKVFSIDLQPLAQTNPLTVYSGFSSRSDDITKIVTIDGVQYLKTFIWSGTGPYTLTISIYSLVA